jgi:hypothetical protein
MYFHCPLNLDIKIECNWYLTLHANIAIMSEEQLLTCLATMVKNFPDRQVYADIQKIVIEKLQRYETPMNKDYEKFINNGEVFTKFEDAIIKFNNGVLLNVRDKYKNATIDEYQTFVSGLLRYSKSFDKEKLYEIIPCDANQKTTILYKDMIKEELLELYGYIKILFEIPDEQIVFIKNNNSDDVTIVLDIFGDAYTNREKIERFKEKINIMNKSLASKLSSQKIEREAKTDFSKMLCMAMRIDPKTMVTTINDSIPSIIHHEHKYYDNRKYIINLNNATNTQIAIGDHCDMKTINNTAEKNPSTWVDQNPPLLNITCQDYYNKMLKECKIHISPQEFAKIMSKKYNKKRHGTAYTWKLH